MSAMLRPPSRSPSSSKLSYANNDLHGASPEELALLERTVWRKIDWWILPVTAIFYLLSFLDRSNISNARVAGMQTDLKMTDKQYTIALTVTYVPYIAAELPSNLMLKAVGPNRMLPTLIALWGIVTTLQGTIHNYSGLLACRFFLGMLEGGLFPGLVFYLSLFYPRSRLNIRVATFFSSASLSGAFSGLLAAAIMNMDGIGGKQGWAWVFIIEGLFTFLFGIISFFILPGTPQNARFLSPPERAYVLRMLRTDGSIGEDGTNVEDSFSWKEVGRAFMLPQVQILMAPWFFCGATFFGLAYFEPTIVEALGYTSVRAQLMSVPPFAMAFVISMITAWISDKYRCRGYTAMFASVLCIIGFSMFLGTQRNSVRYASIFFSVSGAYLFAPALATWNANNAAPDTRRATAIAIGFIMSNSGGILATWMLGAISPAPRYLAASIMLMVMSVGMLVGSVVNLIWLRRENRRKERVRAQMERSQEKKDLGDRSAWFVYSL